VSAFDWSKRAIEVGQVLAHELNLRNIDYSQRSFDDLADSQVRRFDLVITYHAFEMSCDGAVKDRAFTYSALSETDLDGLTGQMCAATRAMTSLLTDDGVGVICGNWDVFGLQCLFYSIRKAGLGTDWSRTFWKGGTGDEKGYIFSTRH
jgi:hypothetical protein